LHRALIALGIDGGLDSRRGLAATAAAREGGPNTDPNGCRGKSVPPVAPHRLAEILGGHAIDAPEDRSDRTADSLTTLAIIIGLAVTAYGSLFWLIGWMAGVL
jgi:hypothetical protein